MKRVPVLVLLVALLVGFGAPTASGKPALRMNHVQSRGTHNSTHRDPGHVVSEWSYSHRTLTAQLEEQGVRQIELDVHWNWAKDDFDVYHVWFADDRTTCDTLSGCLGEVDAWLRDHPSSQPVMVLIEPKDGQLEDEDPFTAPFDEHAYARLDEVLRSSVARMVTPDGVTTAGKTLRSSIVEDGWPLLDDVRGSAVFVMDGDDHADRYSAGYTTLAGRAMFVQAPETSPVAAFVGRGGGEAKHERIRSLVAQGFMVRDLDDSEAAKASGAQYLSTDFPEALALSSDSSAPSRCNPVVAPKQCRDTAVERHVAHGYAVPPDPSDAPEQVVADEVDALVVESAESATAYVEGRLRSP